MGEEADSDKEIDRTSGRGDIVHGRNPEIIDLTDDRPLKRKRSLVFIDNNDLEWLKCEVESIRDDMDDFSRDLGLRFAKIVHKYHDKSNFGNNFLICTYLHKISVLCWCDLNIGLITSSKQHRFSNRACVF